MYASMIQMSRRAGELTERHAPAPSVKLIMLMHEALYHVVDRGGQRMFHDNGFYCGRIDNQFFIGIREGFVTYWAKFNAYGNVIEGRNPFGGEDEIPVHDLSFMREAFEGMEKMRAGREWYAVNELPAGQQ